MSSRLDGTTVADRVGTRMRSIRHERGMTLRSVGAQAQVSPSLLSQIERGEASPSLVSLVAIADALMVSPGLLLSDEESPPSTSPVIRTTERRIMDDPECRREFLMHLDDPYLEVVELFVAPGGSTRPALVKHLGRDYGVCLEGEIAIEFPHGHEVLSPGDYIAFDSSKPHRIVNRSDEPARLLWIVLLDRRDHRRPVVSTVAPDRSRD